MAISPEWMREHSTNSGKIAARVRQSVWRLPGRFRPNITRSQFNKEKRMDFITEAKESFGWVADWARARLWHALTLTFVLGLSLGALI
jgi:hypothetical protein